MKKFNLLNIDSTAVTMHYVQVLRKVYIAINFPLQFLFKYVELYESNQQSD